MKRISYLLLMLTFVVTAFAQKPTDREKQQWFKEIQQYRNEFITKELKLTDEQKQKFLPLYNEMDAETSKLNKETRALERSVREKGDKATDIEREKAAEALFELKGRENQIEMGYFKQYKKILTSDQLFKLKGAERKFNREIMKQARKHRGK